MSETFKLHFSKRALLSLPLPTDGQRVSYWDKRVPGLALRVTASGSKAFYVYRRVKGRPARIRLGGFPELTVEQARKRAAAMNMEIMAGGDPQERKRTMREEMTFGELFEQYLETHAKVHKRTWAQDKAQQKRYLTRWKSRRASSITHSDVKALHARLGKANGPYAANRVVALLHTVWEKAREAGYSGPNPASGVRKFKEQSRERFLQADELPKFFKALEAETPTWRDFFMVALMTGARRGNVLGMKWADVHLDRATWVIPMTKSGAAVTLPLAPQVVDILKARKAETKGEYAFPSRGKTGHLVEMKSAWARVLDRAGLDDLRIHDLRRTLGSWQAAGGSSLLVIGKSPRAPVAGVHRGLLTAEP